MSWFLVAPGYGKLPLCSSPHGRVSAFLFLLVCLPLCLFDGGCIEQAFLWGPSLRSLGHSLRPHIAHTLSLHWDHLSPDPPTLGDKQGKFRDPLSLQEEGPKDPLGGNVSSKAGFYGGKFSRSLPPTPQSTWGFPLPSPSSVVDSPFLSLIPKWETCFPPEFPQLLILTFIQVCLFIHSSLCTLNEYQ